MPNLYEIALMLVRLFAGVNLVFGVTCLVGILLIFAPTLLMHREPPDVLFGVVGYLADFGVAALLGGIVLSVLSKRVARYASKQ